jgi:hypothetical protein
VAKVALAAAAAAGVAAGLTPHQAHVLHQEHVVHCAGTGACGSSSGGSSSGGSSARPATVTSGSIAANGSAEVPGTNPGTFSVYGLERLWIAEGGNPSWQAVAACIAEHESGGRVDATGSAGERGLWQIAPGWGSLSTYDPGGNARAAVIISHNGTNWGPWSTRHMCGV